MFSDIGKFKSKNIFLISDFLANTVSSDRKMIAKETSLSYGTISKAVEDLLDIGIITEKTEGKSYVYSLSKKKNSLVVDLTGTDFMLYLCHANGKVSEKIVYKPSDMYFYDENLSFFLKDVSLLLKRKHKSISFYGMAVITPDDTAHYHGSKSILRNTERIAHLLRSYFDVPCVLCTGQSKAAALYAYKESSLVIKKDHSVIKCFYTRSETILPAILKSEKATAIGKNSDGASALAKETAYAVGNVCQIVRPQKLYLDGDGVFLLPSFIRSFTEALAEFTCVEECDLPQIICTDGSLPILGANKELRHKYIEFRLNELGD